MSKDTAPWQMPACPPCPGDQYHYTLCPASALQKPACDHQVISVAFDDATKSLQTLSPRKHFLVFLLCSVSVTFTNFSCFSSGCWRGVSGGAL